jgi:hypothetical protein
MQGGDGGGVPWGLAPVERGELEQGFLWFDSTAGMGGSALGALPAPDWGLAAAASGGNGGSALPPALALQLLLPQQQTVPVMVPVDDGQGHKQQEQEQEQEQEPEMEPGGRAGGRGRKGGRGRGGGSEADRRARNRANQQRFRERQKVTTAAGPPVMKIGLPTILRTCRAGLAHGAARGPACLRRS